MASVVERRSYPLEQAKKVEEEVVDMCRRRKAKFVDPDFPCNQLSLGSGELSKSVVEWARVSDFIDSSSLFVDGVGAGDIVQGALGDCWWLGAISVVATRDDLLYPLFVSAHSDLGFFQIKFFKNGAWRVVSVDDIVPLTQGKRYAFGHCADPSEYWVSLMEKAFAKLNGCYANIESGNFSEGMTDLTGEGSENFKLDSPETQAQLFNGTFWKMLLYFEAEQFLMGCSMSAQSGRHHHHHGTGHEKDDGSGILQGHAYAILQIAEVKVKGKTEQLMKIRNPWGQKEWRGAFSDGSREWTPELRRQLKHEDADDGTFWMRFSDWHRHYNQLSVCRLLTDDVGVVWSKVLFADEWSRSTAGGCCNHSSWTKNPQFWLQTDREVRCFFHLAQEDTRSRGPTSKSISIGLYVFRCDGPPNQRKMERSRNDQVGTPLFINSRDVGSSATLAPGNYILLPCTFDAGVVEKFYLTVCTEVSVKLGKVGGGQGVPVAGQKPNLSRIGWLNRPGTVAPSKKGPLKAPRRELKPSSPRRQYIPPQGLGDHGPPARPSTSPPPPPHPTHRPAPAPPTREAPGQSAAKCGTCLTVASPGAKFCSQCGGKFVAPAPGSSNTHIASNSQSPRGQTLSAKAIKCKRCGKKQAPGETFLVKPDKPNKSYCQKCGVSKCKVCKKGISSGKIMVVNGKEMHDTCFKCSKCRVQLGASFFMDKSKKPVCGRCK